jgi:hypothetical protein
MSKMYSVTGFSYLELSDRARDNAKNCLDDDPIEYDDENGIVKFDYPSEWDDGAIGAHCNDNQYIFDRTGKPIHNLIEG